MRPPRHIAHQMIDPCRKRGPSNEQPSAEILNKRLHSIFDLERVQPTQQASETPDSEPDASMAGGDDEPVSSKPPSAANKRKPAAGKRAAGNTAAKKPAAGKRGAGKAAAKTPAACKKTGAATTGTKKKKKTDPSANDALLRKQGLQLWNLLMRVRVSVERSELQAVIGSKLCRGVVGY